MKKSQWFIVGYSISIEQENLILRCVSIVTYLVLLEKYVCVIKRINMRNLVTGVFLSAAIFSLQACSTTEEGAKNDDRTVSAEDQQGSTAKVQLITAADFNKVKIEKNAIVIDVRTPGEVAEGYIDGATKFIDVNGANFATEIAKLDKSAEYIIYCRSGARSMNASNYMVQNGFSNVYNLQGGILGWNGKIVK